MYPIVQVIEGQDNLPVQLVLPPNTPISESMSKKIDILLPNLYAHIGDAYVSVHDILHTAREYGITVVSVEERDAMMMNTTTTLNGEMVAYINPGFAYAAKRDGEVSTVTYDTVIDALVYAWCNVNGCI